MKLLGVVKMLKKKLGVEAIEKDWYTVCIRNYFKIPADLIIPEGCERIGKWALYNCNNLEKVVIPKSVCKIYDYAFAACENIREVEFFGKRVGYSSFRECYSLVSVIFSENIKAINSHAFWYCKKLQDVTIPESIESIEDYAFGNCLEATINLKKPESEFKFIGDQAFLDCKDVKVC